MGTFGDRFALTPMIGKMANVQDEMERYEKVQSGKLKLLVNGNPGPPVDRKNDTIITLKPAPKLVFICNNLPHVEDSSKGTWNRMLLLHYPRTFSEDQQAKGLVGRIEREELPGILNWAIQGLMRLLRQQRFTEGSLSRVQKEEYKVKCNQVRQFIEEELELGETKAIYSAEIFKMYTIWAEASGIKNRLSKHRLGEELLRIGGITYHKASGGRRHYRGVGVAETHSGFYQVTPDFARPNYTTTRPETAERVFTQDILGIENRLPEADTAIF